MTEALLNALLIALGVQAVFFAFAATLKTDKVTDLSYGLTFVLVAAWLLVTSGRANETVGLAIASMVIVWGVRLAAYLLRRIIHMKRDARFDGVREHFWPFFKFWLFQGIAVWAIMLPVVLWFAGATSSASSSSSRWAIWHTLGAIVWAIGFVIEAVSDQQKFSFKKNGGAKWTDVGLWRWSRHPNYFGELSCWWGLFIVIAPDLAGWWRLVALVGPATITIVIVYLTGLPQLEASADRRWGSDPAYQRYKATTPVLIPWPKRKPARNLQ